MPRPPSQTCGAPVLLSPYSMDQPPIPGSLTGVGEAVLRIRVCAADVVALRRRRLWVVAVQGEELTAQLGGLSRVGQDFEVRLVVRRDLCRAALLADPQRLRLAG